MTTKHICTTFYHQNFEKIINHISYPKIHKLHPEIQILPYTKTFIWFRIKSTKGWGLLIDLIELSFRWKLTYECGDYFPIGGNYRTNVENSFCHIYLTVYVYVCMRNILCIFGLNPKEREIQTWFNGVKYG